MFQPGQGFPGGGPAPDWLQQPPSGMLAPPSMLAPHGMALPPPGGAPLGFMPSMQGMPAAPVPPPSSGAPVVRELRQTLVAAHNCLA
jgi:pre-mRNA-processing factor 8